MARGASIPGERKTWVAYLLWPTLVGHRWYLAELSPVYTLTLGYLGIMWLADLFRIPAMVREYNSFLYQRNMARALYGSRGTAGGSAIGRGPSVSTIEAPLSSTAGSVASACAFRGSGEAGAPSAGEAVTAPSAWEGTHPKAPGDSVTPPPAPPGRRYRITSRTVAIGAAVVLVLVVVAVLSALLGSGGNEETGTEGTQAPAVASEEAENKLSVTLTTPSGLTVTSPNATLQGVTEPGASVTVLGCANAPVHVQAGGDGKFSAALTLNEGSNLLTVIAEKEGRKGSTSCSLTYRLDEASYKAQCRTIEFRVLNKNPDAYKGQKYFATGQVVQIMESFGSTDIRMNVTRDQWGYWDDTIYVTYYGTVPAYEDSIIRVWGEIKGSYSYTSVAGWKITLPMVEAKYIEVVQP